MAELDRIARLWYDNRVTIERVFCWTQPYTLLLNRPGLTVNPANRDKLARPDALNRVFNSIKKNTSELWRVGWCSRKAIKMWASLRCIVARQFYTVNISPFEKLNMGGVLCPQ